MKVMDDHATKQKPLFPGEQWFFYWKTSASLWEEGILSIPSQQIIFIPLNWGFHLEAGPNAVWDFGRFHPEKNLKRLTQLLTQHNRRYCWLLPLVPSPFLPNGGVPVHAAKTLSCAPNGVTLAVLDQEKRLNKMYSYFEPKVFAAFSDFVSAFRNFLKESKSNAPVWGVDYYYFEEDEYISYFNDSSHAFEQGFSRYLKQNSSESKDLSLVEEELRLKHQYTQQAKILFKAMAIDVLGAMWGGDQEICLLGGSPKETIERGVMNGKSQEHYLRDLFHHHVNQKWISSSLLFSDEKKLQLKSVLDEHFGTSAIENIYHYQTYSGELDENFRPLGLVEFVGLDKNFLEHSSLALYLTKHLRWVYSIRENVDFSGDSLDQEPQRTKFFFGKTLDAKKFSQMLKLFFMGQRVVLDKSKLPQELEKKLQVFLQENNFKLQTINFISIVNICELGEGQLIIFEGDKLLNHPDSLKFWEQVFKYFNLPQPELTADKEVYGLWRIRAATPAELNYLDVRRVNLYNPTSYKKNVTIKTQKHFALMKSLNTIHSVAKSFPDGVEIELLPGGQMTLDFGHYEEVR